MNPGAPAGRTPRRRERLFLNCDAFITGRAAERAVKCGSEFVAAPYQGDESRSKCT